MTSAKRPYRRILLKISGDGFCSEEGQGIDPKEVAWIARAATRAVKMGKEFAIVVGGGNIIRGATFSKHGINRATADYMGMLATIINALALQDAIEREGIPTRVLSALEMHQVAEPFIRRRAIRHLERGRVIILAGGTGNPYFTTDTTAALRAKEIGADILLKATKVAGVYSDDPKTNPDATLYTRLTYMDVLQKKLRVMDATAITLCMENSLPILVFNLKEEGNIQKAMLGEEIGTLISD